MLKGDTGGKLRCCSHDDLDHLASHRCEFGTGTGKGRMRESFASYLPYVGGFLRVLWFLPPVKLTFIIIIITASI